MHNIEEKEKGKDIHQRVRKTHFGTIYDAIAYTLDNGKSIMVSRIE
jgi:hypothetical protein